MFRGKLLVSGTVRENPVICSEVFWQHAVHKCWEEDYLSFWDDIFFRGELLNFRGCIIIQMWCPVYRCFHNMLFLITKEAQQEIQLHNRNIVGFSLPCSHATTLSLGSAHTIMNGVGIFTNIAIASISPRVKMVWNGAVQLDCFRILSEGFKWNNPT